MPELEIDRREGRLLLGGEPGETRLPTDRPVRLRLSGQPRAGRYRVTLAAMNPATDDPLASVEQDFVAAAVTGNLALLSHYTDYDGQPDVASARFGRWTLDGAQLVSMPDRLRGREPAADRTGREPSIIHDRVTGYGIVVFDKASRTIRIECWPRYVDPDRDPEGQYEGWPITIAQDDNDGRRAEAWLPEIRVEGSEQPVVDVIDARTRETVYSLRVRGNRFRPKVFAEGTYTVRVSDPDRSILDERSGVAATRENRDFLTFRLGGAPRGKAE